MKNTDYFAYLVDEIHSVIAATTDENGLPVTCAIDIMDWGENGLYFLTAKGKNFYRRLKQQKYIALTGMKGAPCPARRSPFVETWWNLVRSGCHGCSKRIRICIGFTPLRRALLR